MDEHTARRQADADFRRESENSTGGGGTGPEKPKGGGGGSSIDIPPGTRIVINGITYVIGEDGFPIRVAE